jgi:hypothetical protein
MRIDTMDQVSCREKQETIFKIENISNDGQAV